MFIDIEATATFNNDFKKLISKTIYEPIILKLMNSSTKLFPNEYEYIENQSNGECDFRDKVTSQKFDAKLILTEKDGKSIGSDNHNYLKWLQSIFKINNEYKGYFECSENFDVATSSLYKTMSRLLKKVKPDENVIFFIPYPIVLDEEGMVYHQFCDDILSIVFDTLRKNDLINKRMIYVIYPNFQNKIVLRCLNTYVREYLEYDELQKYIKYDIKSINY